MTIWDVLLFQPWVIPLLVTLVACGGAALVLLVLELVARKLAPVAAVAGDPFTPAWNGPLVSAAAPATLDPCCDERGVPLVRYESRAEAMAAERAWAADRG